MIRIILLFFVTEFGAMTFRSNPVGALVALSTYHRGTFEMSLIEVKVEF